MREFINIVENLTPRTFFHASNAELSIGDVLRPRNNIMLDGDIDDIIERNRPPNRPNRNTMIYMVKDLGDLDNVAIDQNHLYAVTPSGDIFWADHAWINAIWHEVVVNGDDGNAMTQEIDSLCDQYAKSYWNEELSRFGRKNPSTIEWLATSATVTDIIK